MLFTSLVASGKNLRASSMPSFCSSRRAKQNLYWGKTAGRFALESGTRVVVRYN